MCFADLIILEGHEYKPSAFLVGSVVISSSISLSVIGIVYHTNKLYDFLNNTDK
jgi:hypothetical protein